jgi:hypothetical protein
MSTPPMAPPPLHPTVLDVLSRTPAGPFLNQPVQNVLAGMGLPALPLLPAVAPLPGLPPLPVIDPAALLKPITDLFGSFGTGRLGANGAPDPTQILGNITQGLNTALQLGSAGLSLLSLLQGAGSQGATTSGVAAAQNGVDLTNQSTQTSAGVTAASGSVAEGATELAAVAAQFIATMTALGPALVTPAGQAGLMIAAAEAGAQAAAITAKTKAELSGHAANMAQTGTPVPITPAPTGGSGSSPLQEITQLLGVVQPLLGPAMQAVGGLLTPKPTDVAKPLTDIDEKLQPGAAARVGAGALGGAALGGGGGYGGAAGVPRTLSAWSGSKIDSVGTLDDVAADAVPDMTPAAESSMPMMPMGAGLTAARGATDAQHATGMHDILVNAQHGNEVVGEIDGIAPPVVGGVDWQSDAPDDAPDKALSL